MKHQKGTIWTFKSDAKVWTRLLLSLILESSFSIIKKTNEPCPYVPCSNFIPPPKNFLQISIQSMNFFLSTVSYMWLLTSCRPPCPLIRLRLLPLQCLLSSPYQMSSCRRRAATAYRCVHGGTATAKLPPAANTDLRQDPAHERLTGTCSFLLYAHSQTRSEARRWKCEGAALWSGWVEPGYCRSFIWFSVFLSKVLNHLLL